MAPIGSPEGVYLDTRRYRNETMKCFEKIRVQFGAKTVWHGLGDMSPLAHAANVHIDLSAPYFGVQEWSGIESPNFVI